MSSYPVTLDIEKPLSYSRTQVAVRLLLLVLLGLLGGSLGWLFLLLYVGLPVVAAVIVSQRGANVLLQQIAPKMIEMLHWILSLYAYFAFLTDVLPLSASPAEVRFSVNPSGTPTAGSALLRILTAVPSAFLFGLLICIGSFLWLWSLLRILFTKQMGEFSYDWMRALLRWQARLLVFMASLIEVYPPFALDLEGKMRPAHGPG